MTFEQMHTEMDVLMDKTTTPWLDPLQKDVYLNLALEDWPNWLYEGFEKNARRRTEFGDLVRHFEKENSNIISKPEITGLKYVVGVRAKFLFYEEDEKGGLVERHDIVPVSPMSHDELGTAYTDPHRTPTDVFPFYTEYKDTRGIPVFEVHSDNVPGMVRITYLEDFGKIDGLNSPTESLLFPDSVCMKIVQLAVVKAQSSTQDPRYETSNIELQRSS